VKKFFRKLVADFVSIFKPAGVKWPSWKTSFQHTGVVLIVSLVMSAIMMGSDALAGFVFGLVL